MLSLDIGNDDVQNLSVVISAGPNVSGDVSVEGRLTNEVDLAKLHVTLEPVPTGVALVRTQGTIVTAEGKFSILSVWPAIYRFQVVGLPSPAYVK